MLQKKTQRIYSQNNRILKFTYPQKRWEVSFVHRKNYKNVHGLINYIIYVSIRLLKFYELVFLWIGSTQQSVNLFLIYNLYSLKEIGIINDNNYNNNNYIWKWIEICLYITLINWIVHLFIFKFIKLFN